MNIYNNNLFQRAISLCALIESLTLALDYELLLNFSFIKDLSENSCHLPNIHCLYPEYGSLFLIIVSLPLCVLIIFNKAIKFNCFLLFLIYTSLINAHPYLTYGGDLLIRNLFLIAAILPSSIKQYTYSHYFLCWIQAFYLYIGSSINKILNPNWLNGNALKTAFQINHLTRFSFEKIIFNYDLIWIFLSYFAIGTQLLIPFILLSRKYRKYGVLIIIIFHLILEIFFKIGMFSYILCAFSIIFLTFFKNNIKKKKLIKNYSKILVVLVVIIWTLSWSNSFTYFNNSILFQTINRVGFEQTWNMFKNPLKQKNREGKFYLSYRLNKRSILKTKDIDLISHRRVKLFMAATTKSNVASSIVHYYCKKLSPLKLSLSIKKENKDELLFAKYCQ